MNRDKINVIIGDEVVPKLPAEKSALPLPACPSCLTASA